MRLFHVVNFYGAERYVLAEGYDEAVKAMASITTNWSIDEGATVRDLGAPLVWTNPETLADARRAAVDVRKSIMPDALVSFEDGKLYKTLKRHLAGRGLTPAAYREKWGLPPDYPMVAPNYSAVRSALARANGLGRK